ncbi:AMP-binding protein [Pseudaminobacter salicylatoxidans]|uniref:AMP-binding protein n=1 Tax=Pseudaminobacter salicylatoxidans TaxID=93369 RepID=UPI0002E4CFC6|nr:AMP-binding protein [Pseudaminobacter salicylatoxidans]
MQLEDIRTAAESAALHPNWREGDHLLALLAKNAGERPNEVAMRERDHGIWQEYSWADYLDIVVSFAAGLEEAGVTAHDLVAVIGDNRPNLYFAMLGAICLRAVPSPAYPDVPPEELAGQLRREASAWLWPKIRSRLTNSCWRAAAIPTCSSSSTTIRAA